MQTTAPAHRTTYGELYRGDCLSILPELAKESVDLIFADPPFNLGKTYASGINDSLSEEHYLDWSRRWIEACVRLLKPGGSFFLYNLPKWNLALGSFLNTKLTFRHWIAIEMTYRLPISGRLYPSHYSLLYYCKGRKPTTFTPDRMPISTCPKCHHELKDYGGYKDKMNPAGVNLSDVWKDIPPVRHRKFKRRDEANELSIKLLDRVIMMASRPGDIVLDPFGGSGTTYVVAEIKKRRWIGIELGPINQIISRIGPENLEVERGFLERYRAETNVLFTDDVKAARERRGYWVPGRIPKGKPRNHAFLDQEHQAELVLNEQAERYRVRGRKRAKRSA